MELISLQGKANFFESRVSAYQKANFSQAATPRRTGSGSFDDEGKDQRLFRTDAYF